MNTTHAAIDIDVLIPVYNGSRWLREAIGSIQGQSHAALSIHVVDDGSTDDTPSILAELAAVDPRIHIHGQPNGGIVSALTFGLGFCHATFLARHDADDVAHPRRLERQLDHLMSDPCCVAVGAIARHIDAQGQALGTVTELRPHAAADPAWFPAREPYLMHPLLLVRRDALTRAGGYRQVVHSEDSDLYWRLRELGTLHNLPEILADYRVHDDSVSSRSLHNGRLMAVNSQLAALSAGRRGAGRTDLLFDAIGARRLVGAAGLTAMVHAAAERGLTVAERQRLTLATAVKLLELASYQPFELDADDCRFIGAALRHLAPELAGAANRMELQSSAARTAVRLCDKGRWQDAAALLPSRLWPQVIARLAARRLLPPTWRARARSPCSSSAVAP